jgi:predicted  nucleic acid-binding Zn-ribbon protein
MGMAGGWASQTNSAMVDLRYRINKIEQEIGSIRSDTVNARESLKRIEKKLDNVVDQVHKIKR